jgi:hypothetical protein
MERFVGLLGLFSIMVFAWLLSSDRRRVPWRGISARARVIAMLPCAGLPISGPWGWGLSALVPSRRADFARLSFRATPRRLHDRLHRRNLAVTRIGSENRVR